MPAKSLGGFLGVSLLVISMLGLGLLAILTFYPLEQNSFSYQRNAAFVMLAVIDIMGITASFFSPECSGIIDTYSTKEPVEPKKNDRPSIRYEGHHPACREFESHVFKISKKTYCAGCTGLATGATLSLIGVFLALNGVRLQSEGTIFWLGFLLVLLGQLQHLLARRSSMRMVISFGFVFGAFLILVGIDEIVSNNYLNFYFLMLIIFMTMTRAVISRQTHAAICKQCISTCQSDE